MIKSPGGYLIRNELRRDYIYFRSQGIGQSFKEARNLGQYALTKAAMVTPFNLIEDAVVIVDGDKILAAGPAITTAIPSGFREVPLEGLLIAPGFIDQHLHGGGGHDVMTGTAECLAEIAKFHATHGTTAFLATTVSASPEHLIKIAGAYASLNNTPYKGARCLGLHLEGPYLSSKYAGATDTGLLRNPSFGEIQSLQRISNSGIRLVTMAPELDGAIAVAQSLTKSGIACAIGHSDADYELTVKAINTGFGSVTHCFNQLHPLDHQEPGAMGAALTRPELVVELIADGIHIHRSILDLVWRLKGADGIILVSDAMMPVGMPQSALPVNGGKPAGSSLTLESAIRKMMESTDCGLTDVFRMVTYNPARLLGINKHKGSLYPGKDADLVVLTTDLEVVMTMVEGEVISGLIRLD